MGMDEDSVKTYIRDQEAEQVCLEQLNPTHTETPLSYQFRPMRVKRKYAPGVCQELFNSLENQSLMPTALNLFRQYSPPSQS